MSTQDDSGVEFSILPEQEQQHFRLLELPPDLLEAITSDNASPLYFRSQSKPPNLSPDSNAVLCTKSKTYNIRQVNTSNTVYITQPHQPKDSPHPTLQALSQSGFAYELSPIEITARSAVPYIRAALPIYSSTGHHAAKDPVTKDELFANIPFDDGTCETGFSQLSCFELPEKGCFIPSGEAKVRAWKSILRQAQFFSVDITEPLSIAQYSQLVDRTEDWPKELTYAVKENGVIYSQSKPAGMYIFVEGFVISKVGIDQLEAISGSMRISDFLEAWKDQLPEKWREGATLECIKDWYVLENGGKDIKLAREAKEAAPAEAKSLGAKRKWHEKFRASKKKA